ncbi:hypothetical protein F5Y01DRAFT_324779 [Xylaria sp. FL0043]|nr:hypothetical protein F5Y01DRAFT_324779 [Xylaria sp. FL0043]
MGSDSLRLVLPGFGKHVTQPERGKGKSFLQGLEEGWRFESVGLKLREIRMMEFMNQITDKPEWDRKVFDEEIVNKWRREAMGPQAEEMNLDGDVYMTEKMFDYCIRELRDKVQGYQNAGLLSILDAEVEVVKSDSVIPSSLLDLLKAGVQPLEDVPDHQKDWHPRSDGKVLDLLHPSLFPMVYGTSRVLPYGKVPLRGCAKLSGNGETYDMLKGTPWYSLRPALIDSTQWLPSDMAWGPAGSTRITSYINNLHPDDHTELYTVLEQFVAAAVPLWERCLYTYDGDNNVAKPRISQPPLGDEDFFFPEGVVFDRSQLQDDRNTLRGRRNSHQNHWARDDGHEDDYMWTDEYYDWKIQHRVLTWPEPDDYDLSRARCSDMRPDLRTQFPDGLQVIFKLANIHLTPSNPEYGGGSLHVEGALNDRIVATAIFYYDCDNITESVLTFHHRGESASLERWMGISSDDPGLQRLGSVITREGRFIAFPNVLAHQVQPFKLADHSRPGHRKILAMFLVDPHIRILSTSVVPPQRKDWWAREVRKLNPLSKLPTEIFDLIIDFVDGFPMSWEDAIVHRETLMRERSWAKDAFDREMEENTYNFCEH